FASAQEAYAYAPYSGKVYNQSNQFSVTINTVTRNYFIAEPVNGRRYLQCDNNSVTLVYPDGNLKTMYFELSSSSVLIDARFGFKYRVNNNDFYDSNMLYDYLVPFLAIHYYDGNGVPRYSMSVPQRGSTQTWLNQCIPVLSDIAPVTTPVPYNSSSLYDNQTILDTLTKQLEKQGSLTVDYQKTLTAIENKQDAQIKLDQQQLLTDIGIKTTLDEIKANQPKPEDDMNVPKLPSLNDKFPFCVPFDLIHLIQALSATPKSPKWEIPFKFPSFGIDESLTLDLTRYETVAEIVRITTVISFIFFLILVTRRLIKG
ncbi:MAG: hypothetical protein RR313_11790, partial [Anaerovoracaceae bacterium]